MVDGGERGEERGWGWKGVVDGGGRGVWGGKGRGWLMEGGGGWGKAYKVN